MGGAPKTPYGNQNEYPPKRNTTGGRINFEDLRSASYDDEDWPPHHLENYRDLPFKPAFRDPQPLKNQERRSGGKLLGRGGSERPGSLYEKTVQRMNHKKLFNQTMEAKKLRERQQHQALRNEGFRSMMEAGKGRMPVQKAYEKRVGNLIRKPRNDEQPKKKKSNLRNSIIKRILSEEEDLMRNQLHPYERGGHGPGYRGRREANGRGSNSGYLATRDYSLELYKRHLERPNRDPRVLRENSRDHGRRRSASRSMSKSVKRPNLNISNDKINVGRLLDIYKDNGDD